MKSSDLDRAAVLLTLVPPIMHRKMHRGVFRVVLDRIGEDMAPHHLMIMGVLAELSGTSHPAEIAEMTAISKPQMTHSIDRLTELGMIRRQHDAKDRRRVNIRLTEKGRATFEQADEVLKELIKERLSSLQAEDLRKLAESLETMSGILTKMQ